jgi:hypothetical protein
MEDVHSANKFEFLLASARLQAGTFFQIDIRARDLRSGANPALAGPDQVARQLGRGPRLVQTAAATVGPPSMHGAHER